MRVLETETTPSYNMGKNRKHKWRKTKEASESSDDGTPAVPVCNHINMAVNMAAMKKGLAKQVFGECASCCVASRRPERHGDVLGEQASASQVEDNHINLLGDGDITIWVCLQCGNQGCDRNSREKHALKHFETPRSSCHCLVINTSSWTCWCYKCDDDVPLERSKRIQDCLEFLRKQAGLPQPEIKRASQGAMATASSTDQVVNRPMATRSTTAGFCQKIKGLSNLGNTCFFNAVLQNLTQTQSLESQLIERGKKGKGLSIPNKHFSDSDDSSGEESDSEIPPCKDLRSIEITLGEAGPLTQSLLSFLQEMNNNATARGNTVEPNALFNQVCKKAQRFRGFQQQDSHELLRYLLDNMKTEEIKRRQSGILKYFKLSENINPKKVDEETKLKIKVFGKQIRHTFVDTVFGGHLISTVICEECKFISQIFEPFLDLSLPITEEKPQRPNQVLGGRKKEEPETTEEPQAMGVDGFAHRPDKPSKHLERKQKRQAKKDAKKKNKVSKNQVLPLSEEGKEENGVGDEEQQKEGAPEGVDVEEDKKGEEKGAVEEEGNSSNRDDPSDADVEDNLESDTSRVNRFAALSTSYEFDEQVAKDVDTVGNSDMKHKGKSLENGLEEGDSSSQSGQEQAVTDENIVKPSPCSLSKGASGENCTEAGNLSASSSTTCKGSVESESLSGSTSTLKNGDLFNGQENSVLSMSENNIHKSDNEPDVTNKASACAKDCVNGSCKSEEFVDSVRKSLSDTGLVNLRTNNSNGVSHCNDTTCNDTAGDELCDKLHKLRISCDQDNLEHDGTTSNHNTSDGTPLLKSKSVDSIGASCENGRNSPKLVSSGSLKRSCPPLIRQPSKSHSKSKKELRKEAQVKSTVTVGPRYHPSSRECTIMSCLHQFTSAELLTGNNKFGCVNCSKLKHKQNPGKDKKETVYSNASKQYLIFAPPAVLTLHMKRFEQVGFSSRKVNRHVDFPFVLDLAPYCSSLCQGIKPGQQRVLYALYGVVEHSGRLNTGHYTAYVKVRPNIGLASSFLPSSFPSKREYIQRYMESLANSTTIDCEESDEVMEEKLVPPGRWYHISDSRVSEVTDSTVQRAQAYLLFYERIY